MKTIVLLFLCPIFLFGQSSKSLESKAIATNVENAVALVKPSEDELGTLFELSENYGAISVDTCMMLAEKLMSFASDKPNTMHYAFALYSVGNGFRLQGQNEAALDRLSKALTLADQFENNELKADIYNLQAACNVGLGELETAIDLYVKSATLLELNGDLASLGKKYGQISGVYFDQNELGKSQEYNEKVLEIAETLDDNRMRVDGMGLQAVISMTRGIHYYMANVSDSTNLAATTDTLNYYFEKSENEFIVGRKLANEIEDKTLKMNLLNNFVALMLNMEKYDKAEELSLEAHETAQKLGNMDLIIQSKFNLGSYYRRTGNYKLAKQYGLKSLELAKAHNLDRKEYLAQRNLHKLYLEEEDWKNAIGAQDQMRTYETKVAKTERNKAILELDTKYQTALKENKIMELKSENDRITRQRYLLLVGGLLGGILLFFSNRFRKIKKERNDKMELAKALLFTQEEERKRIARDLHDGVGQSLLLIKKQMEAQHGTSLENKAMISETLDEVRSISKGLHPFQLDKFGLTATIRETVEKVERSTDLFITQNMIVIDGLINQSSEIHLFRAIQEAFNNIVKHSKATAAQINIIEQDTDIVVHIRDNGLGFDHEMTISKTKSLGLKTMNERIVTIGGKFDISRNPTKGMLLEFIVPKITKA